MKKIFVLLFVLTFSLPLYAIEVIRSTEPVKIKIDPVDPFTVDIRIPQLKYFKTIKASLKLSDIRQDLSTQYIPEADNEKPVSSGAEEISGKTWAVQEIIAPDKSFEISKVEIKMGRPLENGLELLICDENLFEKTRGIIEYNSDKKECSAVLDPSIQIQGGEHFFLAVKLFGTAIKVENASEEKMAAFYTDYPDGFKDRDPFPEYLNRDLKKSSKNLVYRFYSKQASDIKPTFNVRIKDGIDALWSWNDEEKIVLAGAEISDAIGIYIRDNMNNLKNEREIDIPFVFQSESSTFPFFLELTSWEIDIKVFLDYINELKSGIDKTFKKDENLKETFTKQLQELTNSFREEDIEGLKEKLNTLISDLSNQYGQSFDKAEESKEINDMMTLAKELQSLFAEN